MANSVVETYSRLAAEYDNESNSHSCWAQASALALSSLVLPPRPNLVADVGCGTGRALLQLTEKCPAATFVGIDPAPNMRVLAETNTRTAPQVRIMEGSFERLPLAPQSVDYLYSIFAFHWVTDLEQAIAELARVLAPHASMELFFVGRNNGREFIQATSPIFLRYMGPAQFLEAAKMRKQLTRDDAFTNFSRFFHPSGLNVQESYLTYYDSLEEHLRWWIRVEGQFVSIPPATRPQCDDEVKNAIAALEGPHGIPYTIHQLHVRVGGA